MPAIDLVSRREAGQDVCDIPPCPPPPAMTQNIYDNPAFFAAYAELARSREGLDGAAEWPALRALLPDLSSLAIADLGCGYGWFCRWACAQGAGHVLGLDISERMLERARAMTADEAIAYRRADLERLDLPEGAFALIYSSLALHYVVDLAGLLGAAHRALVPGGRLVFSVEHPILTAPTHPGWSLDAAGRRTWPIDGYAQEGPRVTDWLAKGVVKQPRTLATIVTIVMAAGFTLTHVEEWAPSAAEIAARPELAKERERPMFLLAAAVR